MASAPVFALFMDDGMTYFAVILFGIVLPSLFCSLLGLFINDPRLVSLLRASLILGAVALLLLLLSSSKERRAAPLYIQPEGVNATEDFTE